MPLPLCQHFMTSGARCGSPALKGQPYCYHHHSLRRLLPKRFVTWDTFRNDSVSGARFIPMPLLEDALSIQTAYMQIVYGVLSNQMSLPVARLALAAVRAASRNVPFVRAERAAMAGMQSELSQDVSENQAKVWSNDTQETLYDNTQGMPASRAVPVPIDTAGAVPPAARDGQDTAGRAVPPVAGTAPSGPRIVTAPPPRKEPEAVSAEGVSKTPPGHSSAS